MFDRLTLHASDAAASTRFLEDVLGRGAPWGELEVVQAADDGAVTRRLHVGIAVGSRDEVDRFWRRGIDAGHQDLGAPGPRDYTPDYYGAFLADPDGNSIEAVHRGDDRRDGLIDHVWVRTDDLVAARDEHVALAGGHQLTLYRDTPERVTFTRDGPGGGTFSFVLGKPTTGLDWALTPRS